MWIGPSQDRKLRTEDNKNTERMYIIYATNGIRTRYIDCATTVIDHAIKNPLISQSSSIILTLNKWINDKISNRFADDYRCHRALITAVLSKDLQLHAFDDCHSVNSSSQWLQLARSSSDSSVWSRWETTASSWKSTAVEFGSRLERLCRVGTLRTPKEKFSF